MKLTEHVTYIGVQNPGLRVFDIIMETSYGTSYNSYLVKGDKTAVIETVHADYSEEFIENIEKIQPLSSIDYVILNHTEPDHAGSLVVLLEKNPDIEVIGTAPAIRNLEEITNRKMKSHVVKDWEVLDLGQGVKLEFVIAPNLHWPDSMFTYYAKERVLFSCDVFGCHYSEPRILDTHVKNHEALQKERQNYFNCIFAPFRKYVMAGMKKIENKEIDLICPSHGPVLKEYIEETVKNYHAWSFDMPLEDYAAIFYVSAYGYTKYMAERFAREIRAEGIPAKIYNVIEHDMGEMAKVMNEARAVLFGSPTINKDAVKPIWDLISCTDAINVNKKPVITFGSYGWSGEACKFLNERLRALGYSVIGNGLTCVFKPTQEEKEHIAKATKELVTAMGR